MNQTVIQMSWINHMGLACMLLLGGIGKAGAQTLPASPTVSAISLAEDARLSRSINVQVTGITLEKFLKSLSRPDLTLTCSHTCSEQKVQVRLKGRPLSVLMKALTQWLPGYWEEKSDRSGYTLQMSGSAILRRDNWWALYNAERERALAEHRAVTLRMMRQTAVEGALLQDPGIREGAASQTFFNKLPAALQEQIANALSAADQVGLTSSGMVSSNNAAVQIRLSSLPQAAQSIVQECCPDRIKPDSIIQFVNNGYSLTPLIARPGAEGTPFGLSLPIPFITPFTSEGLTLSLDHSRLAQAYHGSKDIPDNWKKLIAYQESVVWKNKANSEKITFFPLPCRADILDWLADKAAINFIADVYSKQERGLPAEERAKPLARPLEAELNQRAYEQDMSWKRQDDGLILFRNNRWYRDDLLEIPSALIQRLTTEIYPEQAVNRAGKTATMAEAEQLKTQMEISAEVVTELNLWQIAIGLRYAVLQENVALDPQTPPKRWSPFSQLVDTILAAYDLVRFYAGLSQTQRDALLAGRLPLRTLSEMQQRFVLSALPALLPVINNSGADSVLLGMAASRQNMFLLVGVAKFANSPRPSLIDAPLKPKLVITHMESD